MASDTAGPFPAGAPCAISASTRELQPAGRQAIPGARGSGCGKRIALFGVLVFWALAALWLGSRYPALDEKAAVARDTGVGRPDCSYRRVICGLSFDTPIAQFGLGTFSSGEKLEIEWSTAERTVVDKPLLANR